MWWQQPDAPAFHALPLMDYNGVYTNAVHGFLSMLLRCIRRTRARYCSGGV